MNLYIDTIEDKNYGKVFFAMTDRGLRRLTFNEKYGLRAIIEHAESHRLEPAENLRKTAAIKKQLSEYFKGRRKSFKAKLDIDYMPLFKQKVLLAAARIPYGVVASYGDVARLAGSPGAARAVGQVMASNPIAIVIPCHRIIGSSGHLVGYGGGDSLKLKQWLLEQEGVAVRDMKVIFD